MTGEISAQLAMRSIQYDGFGRPLEVTETSDSPLMLMAVPKQKYAYVDAAPISRIATSTLDPSGPSWPYYQTSYTYRDGLGTTVLSLSPDVTRGTWIATDLGTRNRRGLPRVKYQAFTYSGDVNTPVLRPAAGTPEVRFDYDSYGRVTNVYDGNTPIGHREYGALFTRSWDAEGWGGTGAHAQTWFASEKNGHGREVRRTKQLGSGEQELTEFSYLPTGEMVGASQSQAGTRAGATYRERTFDTLGRVVNQYSTIAFARQLVRRT